MSISLLNRVRKFLGIKSKKKEKVSPSDESKPQQEQGKKCRQRAKKSRLTDAYPDYPLTLGRFSRD